MKILANQTNCGTHWTPLSSKNKYGSTICLNENEKLNFEPKVNANIFKNFSNLANDLLKKLSNPKNKFDIWFGQVTLCKISFSRIDEEIILKLL